MCSDSKEEIAKMKSILTALIIKCLDLNTICMLVAKAIAAILTYASKRGGKAWDITKNIITKINCWTSLYLQVFDDETLTSEEEKLIADAIKNKTSIEKIVEIVKRDVEPKKDK